MLSSLSRIDVNLLVALDVLLEERNVTRAAKRLAVTQSAMSQTLQRLRDALGDPLLVRRGLGMVPTPRAEALAAPLRVALESLARAIVEQPSFDPARAKRTFRLALYDVYAISVLPRVVARLVAEAPEVELDVTPVDPDTIEDRLRHGDVDVALLRTRRYPSDLAHESVLRERLVTMLRADHPALAKGTPTAAELARHPHAMIRLSGRGGSEVDSRLATKGISRRVQVRQPYFLAAAAVVSTSDLVISLPRTAGRALAERWPVTLLDPPFGPFEYAIGATWSRHYDAEPGHRWLRELVMQALREVDDDESLAMARDPKKGRGRAASKEARPRPAATTHAPKKRGR
jgi:DNA-binding transcriptional LysR family regulator